MTGRSLRSQLVSGSVLWTLGVMLAVSVLLVAFLATHPRPHTIVLEWVMRVPLAVTFAAGLTCMAAGMWRIRRGLASMDRLRTALAAVQHGERSRLDDALPAEVQPLVDTLNALLADREAQITRAIARAGDLAHGLKTPLAVLAAEAAQVLANGDRALGSSLDDQIRRMQRHIDYHLAHARAAASAGRHDVVTEVEPTVAALFRAMVRVHAERRISLACDSHGRHAVRCRREDLEEMLGNLLDNACRSAAGRVRMSIHDAITITRIVVDDDGPGLDEHMRARVLERGVRADEQAPGYGLGLSITGELAELYGGTLALSEAPTGGLRVQLTLPSADLPQSTAPGP